MRRCFEKEIRKCNIFMRPTPVKHASHWGIRYWKNGKRLFFRLRSKIAPENVYRARIRQLICKSALREIIGNCFNVVCVFV